MLRLFVVLLFASAAGAADPLAAWKNADVRPVAKGDRHTVHTYYVTSPESPDGKSVLFYSSTDPAGHAGDVCVIDRATGTETVLAKGLSTEDAHRVGCQQWVAGGKRVVFHDLRGDQWVVASVDMATKQETVIAKGRQVGIGRANGDVVPVTGLHWKGDDFDGLELVNVVTGEAKVVTTGAAVRKAYPELVAELFGDAPVGIYYPILSPDGGKVVFKLANAKSDNFRSKGASQREGIVCYDLAAGKFLWMQKRWGHPAWAPAGDRVLNVGQIVTNATGETKRYTGFPPFPGTHPSFAPDGKLFTTDAYLDKSGQPWGVYVGDLTGGTSELVHRFENGKGAKSWRPSHPHPAFSADGKRLYFNASADGRTRLHVAEAK